MDAVLPIGFTLKVTEFSNKSYGLFGFGPLQFSVLIL